MKQKCGEGDKTRYGLDPKQEGRLRFRTRKYRVKIPHLPVLCQDDL